MDFIIEYVYHILCTYAGIGGWRCLYTREFEMGFVVMGVVITAYTRRYSEHTDSSGVCTPY